MSKRLRNSRWRRLPGVYRIGDRKTPDLNQEPARLTLYLPGGLLDRAESMAMRAGAADLQQYCERLLTRTLEAEQEREHMEEVEARHGPLKGLDAISNDPGYLAEWTASAAPRIRVQPRPETVVETSYQEPDNPPLERNRKPIHEALEASPSSREPSAAALLVLRHAAVFEDDASGFLACLRRGETIGPALARELLQALIDLEAEFRDTARLDRRLAYALHRLAFEGQVLLTDAWPGTASDTATVDVLRMVQEAVDRVLSGEDIRYYPQGP
ncbi:MAG: hypothetical protein ABI353_06190 [Isosphaeraceae bacterium]